MALRSSWAKERFLAAVKDSETNEVGLLRNLIGSSERWTLVPVDPARLNQGGLYAATRPPSDLAPGSRGGAVHAGSKLILRNSNGQVLSIQDIYGMPKVCTVGEDESLALQAVFEVGVNHRTSEH